MIFKILCFKVIKVSIITNIILRNGLYLITKMRAKLLINLSP